MGIVTMLGKLEGYYYSYTAPTNFMSYLMEADSQKTSQEANPLMMTDHGIQRLVPMMIYGR